MKKTIRKQPGFLRLAAVLACLFCTAALAAQDRGLSLAAKEVVGDAAVGRQWAVFIAVDRYIEWGPLSNPVKDAREIRDILREHYFIDEVRELYDRDATAANIRRLFGDLRQRTGANDSVFVFYAGHGYTDSLTNTGFWIPSDAGRDSLVQSNWLANIQIRNLLSALPAKHVFLISDACFSGDILDTNRGASPNINNDYFKRAYGKVSRQVMTSGASEQVPDSSEFALRLKSALRRSGGSCVDPEALFTTVREVRSTQPLLGVIRGSEHQEGGSFLFFRREASAPAPAGIPAPSPSGTTALGSVTVMSEIAGMIMIDGKETGTRIKAQGSAVITGVSSGSTEVAVKEDNGRASGTLTVLVGQGRNVNAAIMPSGEPGWVRRPPQNTGNTVYFVGKSAKPAAGESYLETRSGALMDILSQFALYREAGVQSTITETTITTATTYLQEYAAKIVSVNISTAGLYRQAEWTGGDGVVYALYAWSASTGTRPGLPVFFGNTPLKNDRVYFWGKAVSQSDNEAELAALAEQDVKMQALLWLGGSIGYTSTDYSYFDSRKEAQESFTASLKFGSRVNIRNDFLRAEAGFMQREEDRRYHYYGLFSTRAGAAGAASVPEHEFFACSVEAERKDGGDKRLKKAVNFNGNRYNRDRAPLPVSDNGGPNMPEWINDPSPDDCLWGIATANEGDSVIDSLMAQSRALSSLSFQRNQKMEYPKYEPEIQISQQITNSTLRGALKIKDYVGSDATTWHLWEIPK
ncbi:MAG: caspase family protein [Treponema sp.]|jgi:hypothetical protein|nr:caspase family protein [Treponema sp.]